MTIEKRFASTGQKVAGRTLSGVAVPYGVSTRIGNFTESFAPGSLTKTLASRGNNRDIVALVDHDASSLLGRVSSGTLTLTETARGVEFSLDVPRTPLGDEILVLAERGDLGGVSFGFVATSDAWENDTRTVTEAELYEISVIRSHAAYDTASSLSVRSFHASAEIDFRKRLYLHYLGGRP